MNKRGDISVLVLVFLVLIVTGAAIVSFYLSLSNQNKIVANVDYVDNIYLQEQDANFYLKQAGENAFIKTYSDFVKDGSYLSIDSFTLDKEIKYFNSKGILNTEEINNKFKEQFETNFIKEFQGYKFEKDNLGSLNDIISRKEFSVNFNGESLILTFKQIKFSFVDSNKKFQADYTSDLLFGFEFKKYKLPSFVEINNVESFCMDKPTIDEAKTCFESSLVNFDVSSLDSNGNSLIQLKTKQSYLIDNSLKSVIFGFVKLWYLLSRLK